VEDENFSVMQLKTEGNRRVARHTKSYRGRRSRGPEQGGAGIKRKRKRGATRPLRRKKKKKGCQAAAILDVGIKACCHGEGVRPTRTRWRRELSAETFLSLEYNSFQKMISRHAVALPT